MITRVHDQPDPLAALLVRLADDARRLDEMDPVFADAITIVDSLNPVPLMIQAVDEAYRTYVDGITVIGDLLKACTAIPGINLVAGPVRLAIQTAERLLKAVAGGIQGLVHGGLSLVDALPDLGDGLQLARGVVHEASVQLPGILDTMRIFGYLIDIADPLVKVLEGLEPVDRLGKVVDALVTIKDGFEHGAELFEPFVGAFETGTDWIVQGLTGAFDAVSDLLTQVHDGISAAIGAFHHIIDPLKKLRSALDDIPDCLEDVASWMADTFNDILKATGLDRLADGLVSAIEKALSFPGEAISFITERLQVTALTAQQAIMGAVQARAWQAAWKVLTDALGELVTRPKTALRELILDLVSAIVGADVDPNKPAHLPDWPLPPHLDGAQGWSPPSRSLPFGMRSALAALPTLVEPPCLAITAVDLASPGLLAARSTDPAVEKLTQTLVRTASALSEAQAIATQLDTQLRAFDTAKTLPKALGSQLTDVSQILTFTADLTGFAKDWTSLGPILDPIEGALQDKATEAAALPARAAEVAAAAEPVDAAVLHVIRSVPLDSSYAHAIGVLDSWGTAAVMLLDLIATGHKLDSNGTHKAAIDAVQSAVDARSEALVTQLESITDLAHQAHETATSLGKRLASVGESYTELGKQGQIVNQEGQPALDEVARRLQIADRILDPLSCLLDAFHCKPGSDDPLGLKSSAAAAAKVIEQLGDETVQALLEALKVGLGLILGEALPIHDTQIAIQMARTTLEAEAPSIQTLCGQLEQQLADLGTAIAPTRTYDRHQGGGVVVISGEFLDQALADQITALLTALQPQPPSAATVPEAPMTQLDWPPLPHSAETLHYLTTPAGLGLTPAQKAAIKSYIEWTQGLTAVGVLIRIAGEAITGSMPDGTEKTVLLASFRSLHDALQATIETLNGLIESIKSGKPPVRPMPPIHIPPWDPGHKAPNSILLVWAAILPTLELAYKEWGGDNTVGAVLWTVIQAGSKVALDLAHYFPNA